MIDYHTEQRQAWLKTLRPNILPDVLGAVALFACIITMMFI